MKTFVNPVLLMALVTLSSPIFAAKDPISWSLDRGLPNPASVGSTYTLRYTLTNQLPLQLVKSLTITKNGIPSNEFSYTDACTGQKLASGASCTVDVSFTPEVAGNKSFQLTIGGFDDNSVPLTKLTTVAEGSANPSNTVYGNVTTSVPANLTVGQPSEYSFTFTNGTGSAISSVDVNVTQTTGTATFRTTCGSSLAAGASCTVMGEFNPEASTPTTQTVTATFSHSGTDILTETTSGTVSATSGLQASFVFPDVLPAEMVGGSANKRTIQARFFNNTGATLTNTARSLSITTGGGSGTFTLDTDPAIDTCMTNGTTPKQLLNGQACTIKGVFEGSTVASDTQVVITGSLTYTGGAGSPAAISTSTYLVPSLSSSRTITLLNNCNFDVWWSFTGAAVSGHTCASSPSSCPAGTSCNTANGNCQWNDPAPNTGTSYKLTASGGTNTVTIPLNAATDPKIQWSGLVSASLGCNESDPTGSCVVAPCDNKNGTTSCGVGKGFVGPATQAEFTMSYNTNDSYDVEVINGFHIPITITPGSHTIPDNYNCGSPGNFTATNNFGSCNFENAVVPGNGYYAVTSGGTACDISTSSSPSGGEVCGIAVDNINKTTNMSKGKFLGYWTADEVCGFNPTKGGKVANAFQCFTPLPTASGFPANTIYFDLMKCAVPTGDKTPLYNSCYLSYTGSTSKEIATCCGCKDWWTVSGISANSNTASCGTQTNPTWNSVMQTQVEWLKKACPSVYVYPFDDKTGGFSCTNNLPSTSTVTNYNTTNYTVTFCQGNTGKPATIDDGRTTI